MRTNDKLQDKDIAGYITGICSHFFINQNDQFMINLVSFVNKFTFAFGNVLWGKSINQYHTLQSISKSDSSSSFICSLKSLHDVIKQEL